MAATSGEPDRSARPNRNGRPGDGAWNDIRTALTPLEQAKVLGEWVDTGLQYSRRKRSSFRRASSILKTATVVLTGASTIILGVQNLDFWAGLGFSLVALATVLAAIEPFFSWRSRWLLMEEQVYRFYRLRDDIVMAVARRGPDQLSNEDVANFYATYARIWDEASARWMEYRRASGSG